MTPDFGGDLQVLRDVARRPLTREQSRWDEEWCRRRDIARRTGKDWKHTIGIAYTRTEAQYGPRPNEEKS